MRCTRVRDDLHHDDPDLPLDQETKEPRGQNWNHKSCKLSVFSSSYSFSDWGQSTDQIVFDYVRSLANTSTAMKLRMGSARRTSEGTLSRRACRAR